MLFIQFMGLEFTKKAPFSTVYIHGLIRDEKGQKIEDYISKLEELRDAMWDAEDAMLDAEEQIEEMKEDLREKLEELKQAYLDFEDRIVEALVAQRSSNRKNSLNHGRR